MKNKRFVKCGLCGECRTCGRDVGRVSVEHKKGCYDAHIIPGCGRPAVAIVNGVESKRGGYWRLAVCKRHLLQNPRILTPLLKDAPPQAGKLVVDPMTAGEIKAKTNLTLRQKAEVETLLAQQRAKPSYRRVKRVAGREREKRLRLFRKMLD